MSDYYLEQLAEMRAEIAALRRERVTYRTAQVVATGDGTFAAEVAGAGQLNGIAAPKQFMPAVGEQVRLTLSGAVPLYEPSGIAEDAVTDRELDPVITDAIDGAAGNAAEALTAAADAQSAAIEASLSADAAVTAANGKNRITYSLNEPTTPPPTGTVGGDLWFQRTNAGTTVGAWEWTGTTWSPRTFGDQVVSSLTASKITSGAISAGTQVTVGDTTDDYVLISSLGVVAYADDPVDGIPNEIAQFGRNIAVRNPSSGMVVGGIDENGRMVAQSGAFGTTDVSFGGRPLGDLLWNLAWGSIGTTQLFTEDAGFDYWSSAPKTDSEMGLVEFSFAAQPGRAYELVSEPFEVWCDTGDAAYLRIRMTTDGSQPLVTTPYARQVVARARAGFSGSSTFSAFLDGPPLPTPTAANPNPTPPGAQLYRLLFTYGVAPGSTGVRLGAHHRFRFRIKDVGPIRPGVGVISSGGGSTQPSLPPPPPPPPPAARITRTDTWPALWARSWQQNGSTISFDDTLYQGTGDSLNGRQVSSFGFPDITGALAGAEIHRVELYMYCEHSWFGDGVDFNIQGHGHIPGGTPALFPGIQPGGFTRRMGKGEGVWIDITHWSEGWKSGYHRGISLTAPSDDKRFYGRAAGLAGNEPALRITYTR